MQTIQAVIMGAVQGISEFLPISSSAHIVFSSAIYKILTGSAIQNVGSEEIFFDILIHLASLLAVIIFFFKDLKEITSGFFNGLIRKDYENPEFKTGVFVLLATFITCVLAFFIKDVAHSLVENPVYVSILLLFTGCILFFSEKLKRKEKNMDFKTAIFIGLAQGLAVFPGLSRSGLTIATGIFNGIERTKAARFSFILSVPIIIIASLIYPILEINPAEIHTFNFKAMALGCIASFATGFFCIKYFMKFLEKFNLKCFAYYCWIMGILMIFISVKFG
ncbi:MAG: undecaprenyl-diphosphate phosphatase [Candidatus Gastranaerophilales bacterium]|nr:undecaprenyl-diphosphate phosphatase [Candidatus Gastranaerophilales bacterium]